MDNLRAPNQQGSVPGAKPSEDEQLIAEMLGGVAFGAYVRTIVVPRIAEFRRRLLLDAGISEQERRELQARLDEHRTLLMRLFAVTESGELPDALGKLFF